MTTDPSINMLTVEQTSHLTGLTPDQIVSWDHEGVLHPSWETERGRPFGRVYSFRDAVGLRTLRLLRNDHHVAIDELRKVGGWLSEHRDTPWSSLRLYVAERRISFDDPNTGARCADLAAGHGTCTIELQSVANEVGARLTAMRKRRSEDIGRIERRRGVVGNAPRLAGTRIPTSAIWSFHEAGYSIEQIIDEYPRLTTDDIRAAIAFEQEQHRGTGTEPAVRPRAS